MQKRGREAGFWPILDLIFSSLRPSNLPLFIGNGRGQSCFHWEKNSVLDSVGKDLNHWFKIGMLHCQICRKRLPELAYSGRRRSLPFRLKCLVGVVKKLQGIICVHVLLDLMDVRCIKCTCKVGNRTNFSGKK